MSGEAPELQAIQPHREGAVLAVHLQPGAHQDELLGVQGGAVRCRVRAPAERGRANAALLALLARELGLVRSALAITAGAASRRKRVLVRGLPPRELAARLRRPPRR